MFTGWLYFFLCDMSFSILPIIILIFTLLDLIVAFATVANYRILGLKLFSVGILQTMFYSLLESMVAIGKSYAMLIPDP